VANELVGTAVSSDALRGYIKTLRVLRKVPQDKLAATIGMGRRTYIDWETGKSKDIKTPFLLRAVKALRGSFDQLVDFPDDATAEDGARLAQAWINSPLAPVVEEVQAKGRIEELERFSRYLILVAGGMAPTDAAREVLSEQE